MLWLPRAHLVGAALPDCVATHERRVPEELTLHVGRDGSLTMSEDPSGVLCRIRHGEGEEQG
jgi:hypothetical protein